MKKKPPPFAKNRHLKKLLRNRHGVYLGRRKQGVLSHLRLAPPKHLVCNEPRHALMVAPTRAGKGTTILMQNALSFPGSMLILDPKGEFRAATMHERSKRHRTITWGPTSFASRWNPLADLAAMPAAEHAEMAMGLARTFLPNNDAKDEFWNISARAFLAGAFQWAATIHPDEPGTLRHVYTLMSRPDQLQRLHQALQRHPNEDLANWAISHLERPTNFAGSIVGSSIARLESFRSGAVSDATATSEFTTVDLLQPRTTLYLTARPSDFARHRALMIAFLQTFVDTVLAHGPLDEPMLLMLDEFSLLRDMPALSTLLTFSAGYNLRLFLVLQDFSGLPKDILQTALSNCQVQLFFGGNDDPQTAEHLVKRIGYHHEKAESRSTSRHGTSRSTSERRTEVMTAQDLRAMEEGLLFTGRAPPAKVELLPWYEDKHLKPLIKDTLPPTPTPYTPKPLDYFIAHTERIVPPPDDDRPAAPDDDHALAELNALDDLDSLFADSTTNDTTE